MGVAKGGVSGIWHLFRAALHSPRTVKLRRAMPNGKTLIVLFLILIVIVNLWLTFTYVPSLSKTVNQLPWEQQGGSRPVKVGSHRVSSSDAERSMNRLPLPPADNEGKQSPVLVRDSQLNNPRDSVQRDSNSRLPDPQKRPEGLKELAPVSNGNAAVAKQPVVAREPVAATTPTSVAVVQRKDAMRERPAPDAIVQGLPLCNSCYDYDPKVVTIFFDQFARMNNYFGTFAGDEIDVPTSCHLPDGVVCRPQHTDNKADIVFKSIQAYSSPIRHCHPQIVAIMNSEAVVSGTMNLADIRIDHHLSGGALYNEACGIPGAEMATRQPPDPSTRRGTGLFLSNCGVRWRSDFIKSVMDHHGSIQSYGRCFHNQKEPSDRHLYLGTYSKHAGKHRTVITFENTIQADYISEKIMLVYESGAIPVYWGPPEIYLWVPGNHSFIDASKYARRPKDLADYLKRVDEDDDLFRYHTTNLDTERTVRMKKRYCENKVCRTCRSALEMKKKRFEQGCT